MDDILAINLLMACGYALFVVLIEPMMAIVKDLRDMQDDVDALKGRICNGE